MAGTGSVNERLVDAFKKAEGGTPTRTIVAKIDNDTEEISSVADGRSSVSIQRDYQQLQTFAEMYGPCYFLVKHQGKGSWRIYTYCPDNESVKTKMLYSTSKDTLLKALGPENFNFDLHTSTKEELKYSSIEENQNTPREAALSQWEKDHNAIIKAEKDEANFRESIKGDNIGGYHPVSVPLDPSAKNLLADFKSGSCDFIELKIADSKDAVVGVGKSNGVQLSNLKPKLNNKEPRYYFISSGASKYLLYLCPENSQISMRMVYSTAKPSVAEAAKACGIRLTKVAEASDVADVDQSLFQRPVASGFRGSHSPASQTRSQEPEWLNHGVLKGGAGGGRPNSARAATGGYGGGTVNSKDQSSKITAAHPTAQLLGGVGNSPGGPKKKIVVPPSGAW